MAIQMVKIRARITVGNALIVETPYIQSFTVNKTRGQPSTFNASLKVSGSQVSGTIAGDSIKIYAGSNSASKLIFSGKVLRSTISPNFEDPTYVILSISGADILNTLQGKKYTRRSTASESSWVSINGIVRQGLRHGKFAARLADGEMIDTIHADPSKESLTETSTVSVVFKEIAGTVSRGAVLPPPLFRTTVILPRSA